MSGVFVPFYSRTLIFPLHTEYINMVRVHSTYRVTYKFHRLSHTMLFLFHMYVYLILENILTLVLFATQYPAEGR